MNQNSVAYLCRLFAAGLCLLALCACGVLSPSSTPHPAFYSLDRARGVAPAAAPAAAPTLIVNPPHAAAGFDSQRIIYVREAHKLEYFAHSEWVDTPPRMLAPLIVAAVENTGAFRAVVPTPSAAVGDLRLDTEIVRLQHDFGSRPSRVRFTLRAYIVDNTTRRVLAWREFDETAAAASEDPYGGVVAANRAVQTVLEHLASFCSNAAGNWQAPAAEVTKHTKGSLLGR
jgi:cholesterol transport system auxiliary component